MDTLDRWPCLDERLCMSPQEVLRAHFLIADYSIYVGFLCRTNPSLILELSDRTDDERDATRDTEC